MSPYRPPPLDSYNSPPRNMPPSYGGNNSGGNGGRRRQQGSRHDHVNPFGSPDSFIAGADEHNRLHSAEAEVADRLALSRPVSAFVAGIDNHIDDDWVKKILEKCGSLKTWKRALDIDDKPLSFGFCEFEDVKGAACAMRVLGSGGDSQSKGLILPPAKVDAQSKLLIFKVDNGFLRACESLNGQPDKEGEDAQTDDSRIRESVEQIIKELGVFLKDHADDIADRDDQADKNGSLEAGDESVDERGSSGPLKSALDKNSRTNASGSSANDIESDPEADLPYENEPFSLEDEEKWERDQAKRYRYERFVLAAEDYEYRLAKEQAERENRIERNALRELDRMEDRQSARDVMAEILSKWDDSREESLCEHEYYRDRERWWHRRKASRAKEVALDKEDREREDRDRQTETDAVSDARSQHHNSLKANAGLTSTAESEQLTKDMSAASIKSPAVSDSIPTDAAALFKWPVKWGFIDDTLIQEIIEPVTRKRLTQYLGAESDDGSIDDLAEFVIGHISEHKPPEELAQELEMVLVEESPVFVSYVWRALVQETERRAHSA
ncbi:hypothetical protein LPJ64_003709 [Coemansia asiatica]|uniref:PWI domain-containing protein n=1 Tax=Coemansia asiatica TaxID=1052880 RepID=A0A9W7XKC1_9FUNG|nr:hypothetical protein LPJ64_003709 [Coemansia asiatica]